MLKQTKKSNSVDMTDFWKITIALLLLVSGYTTSVILLMNFIGHNM